jgi:hypothetical protein
MQGIKTLFWMFRLFDESMPVIASGRLIICSYIVKRVYWEKCLASGRMCKSIFHSYFWLSYYYFTFWQQQKGFVRNMWNFQNIFSFCFAASMKLPLTFGVFRRMWRINYAMTWIIQIIEFWHSSQSFWMKAFFLDGIFQANFSHHNFSHFNTSNFFLFSSGSFFVSYKWF